MEALPNGVKSMAKGQQRCRVGCLLFQKIYLHERSHRVAVID